MDDEQNKSADEGADNGSDADAEAQAAAEAEAKAKADADAAAAAAAAAGDQGAKVDTSDEGAVEINIGDACTCPDGRAGVVGTLDESGKLYCIPLHDQN